jgi:CheY-like chemotaxis protein
MKILVVDDEPSSLKLAHVVLSSGGHDVRPAEGAQAALDMIHEDKPTLILLDLVLPDMDGLALIRKIKSDPKTCDIHIIAITAYPNRFTQAAVMEAGAEAYLVKPLNTRDISGLVSQVGEKKLQKEKTG